MFTRVQQHVVVMACHFSRANHVMDGIYTAPCNSSDHVYDMQILPSPAYMYIPREEDRVFTGPLSSLAGPPKPSALRCRSKRGFQGCLLSIRHRHAY